MRKIKNPEFGEYVLLSQWADHDIMDPWAVGSLAEIKENKNGKMYRVSDNYRFFKHCFRLSEEEGKARLDAPSHV